jgi:hypothetical protein
VDGLAVYGLPVCGAFIITEGVEERLAKGGVGGEAGWVILALGVGGGRALGFVSFGGAVVVVAVGMAVMAAVVVMVVGIVWLISVRSGSGFGL